MTLPDFFAPEIVEDPFAWYQRALKEQPVVALPGGAWMALSYELVSEATARTEDFSNDVSPLMQGANKDHSDIRAISGQGWTPVPTLHQSDAPVHTRARKLLNLAFSMPRVNALEGEIRGLVRGLLDRTDKRGDVEFIRDFASPLPVQVIAAQLGMGVDEAPLVKRWTDAFTDRLGGAASLEREIECAHVILEFQRAKMAKIDARRAEPTEDLLSAIVNATLIDETSFEDGEILSILEQLMVAGNETTTSTLAGGLLLLIQHPEQLEAVRADRSLIPNMVEEMLRYLTPAAGLWRIVRHDTALGGVDLPAGAPLMLRFAAANRDPAVFAEPDSFDIARKDARKHLAFGRGIHQCIGNMLSRKELAVAFEEILDRYDRIELVPGANTLRHVPNNLLRGLAELHVRFGQFAHAG